MGRAFLALYQATGEREWLKRAESAVGFIERRFRGEPGYLSVPPRAGAVLEPRTQVDENVAVARFGILLTARELAEDPAHLTVVGAKSDPAAQALYRAALARPGVYRRVEWWDAAEGPLPNPDVRYPQLERAAVFVCADRTCSLPLFTAADLARFPGRLAR